MPGARLVPMSMMWTQTFSGPQLSGRLTNIHKPVSTSRWGAVIKAQTLGSGRTTEKVHPNVCREVTVKFWDQGKGQWQVSGGTGWARKGLRSHRGNRSSLKLLSFARSPATSNAARRLKKVKTEGKPLTGTHASENNFIVQLSQNVNSTGSGTKREVMEVS